MKDLQDHFNSLNIEKRRIEGDLMSLQSELKDLEDEVRSAEERAGKAESEVQLVHSNHISCYRKRRPILPFMYGRIV